MALSTDVKLPKTMDPIYPHRCVRCPRPPTTTVRVRTHAIGWWTALLSFGSRFEAHVPACDACISKLVWQRRGRFVISLLFICVGVFIAHRVLGDFKGINKAITIAITLASCVPWFLWEVFVPRAIELTAFKDTVDYEFADPDFAAEFAELNGVSAD